MSGLVGQLAELLRFEKERYLTKCEIKGGTAEGFRQYCVEQYEADRKKFAKLEREAFLEAVTRRWQAPPRKHVPELFDIAGGTIPEYLTRARTFVDGDDIADDDESKFEKVHYKFATVGDLYANATINLRKAAQAGTAAERLMQIADEARRRARGKLDVPLSSIRDSA